MANEPILVQSKDTLGIDSPEEYSAKLHEYANTFPLTAFDIEVEEEYSGAGTYRFQIWRNRGKGLPPLLSLKWEGL